MRVAGWGCNESGQLAVNPTSELVSKPHFLSLPEDVSPTVASAGLSSSLVFTRGSTNPITLPPATPTQQLEGTSALPPISSVSAGHDFTLFVAVNGDLYVSGIGGFGQLAHGPDVAALPYPSLVTGLQGVKITSASAGSQHWLALDGSSNVFACGHNASGQCGDGTTDNVYVPVCVTALWSAPVVAVSCGDKHSAVLTSGGDIFCFGSNKYGQIGQAAFTVKLCSLYPMRVPQVLTDSISEADGEGDVVMSEGNLEPRGAETSLGAGSSVSHSTAASVQKREHLRLSRYVDVACGGMHTVALRSDGAIVCWGRGERGQVGNKSTANSYAPVVVRPSGDSGSARFASVAAGSQHSAGVTTEGVAYVWGDGTLGQVGDGDMSDKLLPVPIRPPKLTGEDGGKEVRFLRVLCGAYHNLALMSSTSSMLAEPVYSAAEAYSERIPLLRVDSMLSAASGLPRFSSAAVLYRNYVGIGRSVDGIAVDVAGCVKAYATFRNLFGSEGSTILIRAAARLRREALAALGMLIDRGSWKIFLKGPSANDAVPMSSAGAVRAVTTASELLLSEEDSHADVAGMRETGIVLFLAFLSPIYEEKNKERMRELGELVSLVVRIRRDARRAFIACVRVCPPELTLKCLIRPMQHLISDELSSKRRVTKRTTNTVRVLDLVYRANEETQAEIRRVATSASSRDMEDMDEDLAIVDPEEFYNPSVSNLVNLREDWLRWMNSQHKSSQGSVNDTEGDRSDGSGEGLFSFCEFSFLLNQLAKSKILSVEAHQKMESEHHRSLMSFGTLSMPLNFSHVQSMGFLVLNVRRAQIVADTFFQLAQVADRAPNDLHKVLKVQFEGEPGEDEGGLTKEFFQVLTGEVFSPSYGMFEYHEDTRQHWFARDSPQEADEFRLVGICLGLALFNSILLDIQFPAVIYRKLHGAIQMKAKKANEPYIPTLDDVKDVFPEIGNSLTHLLAYEGDDVEHVFCLTYEVPYEGLYGRASAELVPGGADKPVTSENKRDFVQRYIKYLMVDSFGDAFESFAEGIMFMMSGQFVAKLSPEELETLVIGERELDFEALRATTRYETYSADSLVIQNLWTVLFELDTEMRRKFLSFVCGSDRAPIGGLGNLNLIIQRSGGDSDRLPTSHTCFNVLLLPEYNTRAKLRSLLILAIQNSTGFGLQ